MFSQQNHSLILQGSKDILSQCTINSTFRVNWREILYVNQRPAHATLVTNVLAVDMLEVDISFLKKLAVTYSYRLFSALNFSCVTFSRHIPNSPISQPTRAVQVVSIYVIVWLQAMICRFTGVSLVFQVSVALLPPFSPNFLLLLQRIQFQKRTQCVEVTMHEMFFNFSYLDLLVVEFMFCRLIMIFRLFETIKTCQFVIFIFAILWACFFFLICQFLLL